VKYIADSHTLEVETYNIQQLSIDCRSIAEEKTDDILNKKYEDNLNLYKSYFEDMGKEFTVNVKADHEIDITFKDIPYPSSVIVDNDEYNEGVDYTYSDGSIETMVPEDQSEVKIYFQENADTLTPNFITNNPDFYHAPNTNIEFDATVSTGNIIDYIWDFSDGSFGTDAEILHRFGADGDYDVTLVVRDGNGRIKRVTNTIYVHDIDNDNLPDDWEEDYLNGLSAGRNDDNDNDELKNWEEYDYSTNPKEKDSDGDGFNDKVEIDKKTDPNNRASKPKDEKEEDNGMLGLGRVAGIDLAMLLILIIVIIIVIVIAGALRGKKEQEEELIEEDEGEMEQVQVAEEFEEEAEVYDCPECGAPITEDQLECDECGATLEWDEEEMEDEVEDESEEEYDDEYDDEIEYADEEEDEAAISAAANDEYECPTCGASVGDDDVVCPTCGEEFE
jgi:DNA-directed RNA polymerase subunit RPC12/RpoP